MSRTCHALVTQITALEIPSDISLSKKRKMTKRKVLSLLLSLIISTGTAFSQNDNLYPMDTTEFSADTLLLDAVVVTPRVLNTFGNKESIELGEDARKIGNNALDAIGSLPQFKTNASSGDLMTVDNKSILVLIDGIRRSTRDLMILRSEDIRKIQLYSNPPARYAHENIGAVIDVTTRKKTDRLYRVYLDTKNGVTTGYGTDMLSLAYMDSLNMVTAAYFIDYRALKDNRMNNTLLVFRQD